MRTKGWRCACAVHVILYSTRPPASREATLAAAGKLSLVIEGFQPNRSFKVKSLIPLNQTRRAWSGGRMASK